MAIRTTQESADGAAMTTTACLSTGAYSADLVARARAALPQVPRDHGAEFQHPTAHRLIGDIEPTFSEELFHVR